MTPTALLLEMADDLRVVAGSVGAESAGLRDDELLEFMAATEAVVRLGSALQVHLAGEVGVRSRRGSSMGTST
jgi:hypothetical protein